MMAGLPQEAVHKYRRDGYVSPVPVMSAAEAQGYRHRLEAAEASGRLPAGALRSKSHLLLTWVDEIVRHPRVLDAVESIVGPDILVWGTSFFIKEPHNASFVSWHQDLTYWGLEPADIVTAWIALSESTSENGAMRVIPGTHTTEVVPHKDTFAADNLLSRGQEISVEVDEARAVTLELAPGEMSLHHVKLIHGSEPNPSPKRRIGLAVRYIPTSVRQTAGEADSATLVRGTDAFGHFRPEQRPVADLSEAAIAHHAQVTGASARILMRGTGRTM
jgi:ectoine hydroxylase-related dioxygenase (phytanoyl-CoA dioxygenase family)